MQFFTFKLFSKQQAESSPFSEKVTLSTKPPADAEMERKTFWYLSRSETLKKETLNSSFRSSHFTLYKQ